MPTAGDLGRPTEVRLQMVSRLDGSRGMKRQKGGRRAFLVWETANAKVKKQVMLHEEQQVDQWGYIVEYLEGSKV